MQDGGRRTGKLKPLTLGYSPCPNDTFIFCAIAEKKIEVPFALDILLDDVEMLNKRVVRGALDISKISANAAADILDRYWLLRSGGAMGRGCGPLVVARSPVEFKDLRYASMATPGDLTTAGLLLRIEGTHQGRRIPMRFDRIMPAVAAGEVDAGVVIHEGRWTYDTYGLHVALDLGRWWESQTGLPVPLGVIAMRRDLGSEIAGAIEETIRESLHYVREHPDQAMPYIRRYAQEMSPEVINLHIDTFVNEFTVDSGGEGEKAMRTLLEAAYALAKKPFPKQELFWR
jgi:1,4-dihydroxy-6-naphthoate synthase